MRRAERARSLVDVETFLQEAEREVTDAETRLKAAADAADQATVAEARAAEALKREDERADEIDALRQSKGELERFGRVLAAAAGSLEGVETALIAQQEASDALATVAAELTNVQGTRTAGIAGLKVARETATLRSGISGRRESLQAQLAAARTYETALRHVQSAHLEVEKLRPMAEAASTKAKKAQLGLETAERNLATAQALHLAVKLEDGSPCPVCGATEHPAPATGDIGNAGLDKAFREARDEWQSADGEHRQAAERLAALRATLEERENRLSGLDRPDDTSEILAGRLAREDEALLALGPEVDIAASELKIEEMNALIVSLERQRDGLRNHFEECRNKATQARTAYEGKLSEVPAGLRDAGALATAMQTVSVSLDALLAAKTAADRRFRDAREAALGAAKDLEGTGKARATCEERRRKAVEAFQTRLADTGLTAEVFQSLKPEIETLDADRETVETYWREHKSAADAATKAASATEGMIRPDLAALRRSHEALAQMLGEATEARVGAKNRVEHLGRLRAGLEDTLRKLDEAESASGPLRGLAALVNGQNAQRLTLETFAIGEMFDQVLEAANLRLGPMTSGRYKLERDLDGAGRGSRGLGIQVFDVHTGKSRATTTLSGGETFIAALSLALGLADAVESASGKVRLDTIFIDEGFGSLDTENGSGTLDQVLQVLNSIVRQNRAVGLISHVPLVQEAIPNGFYIRKGLAGSSIEERGVI